MTGVNENSFEMSGIATDSDERSTKLTATNKSIIKNIFQCTEVLTAAVVLAMPISTILYRVFYILCIVQMNQPTTAYRASKAI